MPAAATKPHWPVVTIVGVGLIGGSIGLALRARKLVGRVIGVGRSAASLAEARRLGAATETTTDVAQAVAYLCEASYVTGEVLIVDGGRHIRT